MFEIKPRQCIGIGKSLICIRAESMTSPLFITQEKSVFLHTNLVPSSILIRWFTNEGLPPYIIKWIVVSFHMEKHNRNNRLAQACPLSTLSPVFGPSIKKKIRIREAITQQREKRLTLSYLALKLRYINKTHTERGDEKCLFQFSLCLLISR